MNNKFTERRNSGERRWGMVVDFPVKDSNGILVMNDRRCMSDRRLENTSLEDRLLMFGGMPQIEAEND